MGKTRATIDGILGGRLPGNFSTFDSTLILADALDALEERVNANATDITTRFESETAILLTAIQNLRARLAVLEEHVNGPLLDEEACEEDGFRSIRANTQALAELRQVMEEFIAREDSSPLAAKLAGAEEERDAFKEKLERVQQLCGPYSAKEQRAYANTMRMVGEFEAAAVWRIQAKVLEAIEGTSSDCASSPAAAQTGAYLQCTLEQKLARAEQERDAQRQLADNRWRSLIERNRQLGEAENQRDALAEKLEKVRGIVSHGTATEFRQWAETYQNRGSYSDARLSRWCANLLDIIDGPPNG